jgi:hypothetical protein
MWKYERKRPLGRPQRRWENENEMNFKEARRECLVWTRLVYERNQWCAVVKRVMNFHCA